MAEHHRVSEEGKLLGRLSSKAAERGLARLAAADLLGHNMPGMREEMCASCACRSGSIPNGCLQTQLDFLKCVVKGKPFTCHAPKDGRMCAGYVGARAEHVARPFTPEVVAIADNWEYSPPDEVPSDG